MRKKLNTSQSGTSGTKEFLPPNPFLELVPARVKKALERLESLLWTDTGTEVQIAAALPRREYVEMEAARNLPLKEIRRLPAYYGRLWDQRWFRLRFPAVKSDTWLRWSDEAEATLYLNGVPYFGFDVAHREVKLPGKTCEVWVESIVCQTAIWHPKATGLSPSGSKLEGARLLRRDESIWQAFHDFQVLGDLMRSLLAESFPGRVEDFFSVGAMPPMGRVPALLRKLLRFLDRAVDALDGNGPADAGEILARAFDKLKGETISPAAVLTGHAHIDLVWLWPERVGERKAVHTFATALRLMEEYPEFRFAYSQPASYDAVKKISPSLAGEVGRFRSLGKWEAEGASYVESDTLLPCGEALLRNFALGQEGFRQLNGRPSNILWLPDVFGYSGCLPQIMLESGVRYFFTTKLTWNAINGFPFSSFRWIGIDGSEVVAHLCQDNGYNQSVTAVELRRGADAHRQSDVHDEFLAPVGFGDGGGGVTHGMCERARRFSNLAGVPRTRWGSLQNFFSGLDAVRAQLPAFRGELYFEYHRGTYTTHGRIKELYRKAEVAMQTLEAFACASGTVDVPKEDWKRVVFAQFHDYLPGSSIHEVYEEAARELSDIHARSISAVSRGLSSSPGRADCVFNPVAQPRLYLTQNDELLRLPPLSGVDMKSAERESASPVEVSTDRISNGIVSARFDSAGRISALRIRDRNIPLAAPANELLVFPDFPHAFEAWDIDRQTLSLGRSNAGEATVKISRPGSLRAEISFAKAIGQNSHVVIRYALQAGSPALEITYELDWQDPNALLKAAFPTGFLGSQARFGSPFGSILRPQLGGNRLAEAMWEVPGSRWATVLDDCQSEGFFVVTEAKYGFACREGVLTSSLVRSAKITSEDRGPLRGSHPESIRRSLSPKIHSDLGKHKIRMAIGGFRFDAPRAEQPASLAETLFTPVIPYKGSPLNCGFLGLVGGDSLQPCWAMPLAADRWVLRLHETLGRSGTTRILLHPEWEALPLDLANEPLGKPGDALNFSPYKILSVRIRHK